MPYFQSAGRKCTNRKTKSPLELLKKSLAMETLAGDFFYPFKMCTAQENANFAELKIFCQKILGILG